MRFPNKIRHWEGKEIPGTTQDVRQGHHKILVRLQIVATAGHWNSSIIIGSLISYHQIIEAGLILAMREIDRK